MTDAGRYRRVTGPKGGPRIGDTGRKAETKVAKRTGGRLTTSSGNQLGDKGDMEFPDFLFETKATEAEGYGLKLDLLAKISREAMAKGKAPGFHVQFVTGDARPRKFGSWVMVPEEYWRQIEAMYGARD